MSFSTINQKPRTYTRVHEVRFAITNTPTARNGRLTLPSSILTELDWKHGVCLEVMAGSDEDAGWYALRLLSEPVRHRAKLKIRANGVGQFNSQALVPASIVGTMQTFQPEIRIEEGVLYVKIF